jgi:phage terminase small subunit
MAPARHLEPWPAEPRALTLRQERFIDALVKCGQQREAAIAAGYSPKSAHFVASKLMKNANVRSEYEKRKAAWVPTVAVDVDDVVREAAMLAFHDPTAIFDDEGQLLPVPRWPLRARRSIASIEVVTKKGLPGEDSTHRVTRVKFHDKTKSLELLARHLGMLVERREVGGPGAFAALSDEELAVRIHEASSRLAALTGPVKTLPAADSEERTPEQRRSRQGACRLTDRAPHATPAPPMSGVRTRRSVEIVEQPEGVPLVND